MTYNDLLRRTDVLREGGHTVKFYEMVLCYGLLNLHTMHEFFKDKEFISEEHFKALLNIMVDYLEHCYHVAPWDVADALRLLIDDKGVEAVIEDYNNCGTMLEDKLCEM